MNFYQLIIVYQLLVVIVVIVGERFPSIPALENDTKYSSKEAVNFLLDESIVETIERTIEEIINRLLTEGNDTLNVLDLEILRKAQANIQSRIRAPRKNASSLTTSTNSRSSSLDATILAAVERSIKLNLKEALLQYPGAGNSRDALDKFLHLIPVTSKGNSHQEGDKPDGKSVVETNPIENSANELNVEFKPKECTAEGKLNSSKDKSPTLLILPKSYNGGRVFTQLLAAGIYLTDFGVNSVTEFPSGGVTMRFNSEEGKENLKKAVDDSERFYIRDSEKKSYTRTVRIRKFLANLTFKEEEIANSIFAQFGEFPEKISFVYSPYEADQKFKDIVLHVSDELFKKMEEAPQVRIQDELYDIDTSLIVNRCFRCHLLGHTTKSCRFQRRPAPSEDENCLDCCLYNRQTRDLKLIGRDLRDVDHPTDHENCKTKKYYLNLWQGQKSGQELKEESDKQDCEEASESMLVTKNDELSKEFLEKVTSTNRIDDSNFQISEEQMRKGNNEQGTVVENNMDLPDDSPTVMLVIPKMRGIRVMNELVLSGIHTENGGFGVKKVVEFPSGAALFEFESAEKKIELKEIVDQLKNIASRTQKQTIPSAVRIKMIPSVVKDEEIWHNVTHQFGEPPLKVTFVFQKDVPSNSMFFRTVLLYVTETLLQKMEVFPYIQIRDYEYRIDTSIYVPRCSRCKLMGHTDKGCQLYPRPSPTIFESCIDCSSYNRQIIHMNMVGKRILRNVNHPTGHDNCGTKRFYESRHLKQRAKNH